MPYDFINTTGIVVSNTSDVLETVQSVWRDAFGVGLNLNAETPQGRIIELQTLERKNIMNIVAYMCNQINPKYSTGTYLNAIAGFFDIQRVGETYTEVLFVQLTGRPLTYSTGSATFNSQPSIGETITINDVTYAFGDDIEIGASILDTATNLETKINENSDTIFVTATTTGDTVDLVSTQLSSIDTQYPVEISADSEHITTDSTNGYTIIPAGSMAETTAGDLFVLSGSVFLDSSGNGFGTFVAQESGSIPCNAHDLNKIITTIDGWETVDNGSSGILGALVESDYHLRNRVERSKFKWSTNMVRSISSALYEINGLKSLYIYENYDGTDYTTADDPIIPVGETVKRHSVMIVVHGGTNDGTFDKQVASAILAKRSGGCGMSEVADSTHVKKVVVQDGTYQTPYTMTFNTAAPKHIAISLEVKNISFTGANLEESVKEILLNWFSGNIDGVEGVQIGQSISVFDITSVLSAQIGISIKSCLIGVVGDAMSINEVPVPFTQIATLNLDNITVSVL